MSTTLKYRQALNLALREEMRRDDGVILVGEDIGIYDGSFRVTEGLLKEFGPARVIDTPLSENGFVSFGIGAAMAGMRPVVEMMLHGLVALATDSIINQAAIMKARSGGQIKCPIVIRSPGGSRPWGGPMNNQNLDSLLFSIPGLKIALPSTPRDARGMLKAAIRDDDPVLFFEHTTLYFTEGAVPDDEEVIPLGRG
ncbi:MAG: alpha-ketoacid dehydrogenase subunit beta, partial [Chloroflexi bacterium]|nr:alpha-ketoacid dehydrogenase subunit beta [Chloroflexota bacterium]